jgi:hypothetical protein
MDIFWWNFVKLFSEKSNRDRLFIKPIKEYGAPDELLKWSKMPEFLKHESHC